MVPELKLGLPHEQKTIMTLKLMVTPNHNWQNVAWPRLV